MRHVSLADIIRVDPPRRLAPHFALAVNAVFSQSFGSIAAGLVPVGAGGLVLAALVGLRRPHSLHVWLSALSSLVIAGIGVLGLLGDAGPPALFATGEGQPSLLSGMRFTSPLFVVDALSGWFLLPVGLLGGLAAVYGHGPGGYSADSRGAPRLFAFVNALLASLLLVLTAASPLVFLLGWELMALAAYFLVTHDDDPAASRAGLIYIVAAHVGALCLFALFSLDAAALRTPGAIALAIVGFGMKAGLMPFHVWLPPAHAAAPSHASAVLSGVVLKTGVYGLIRFAAVAPSNGLAGALLVIGGLSAVFGVTFALTQADLKRVLAFSSVENVGLIALALGLSVHGRLGGDPAVATLALAGAVLHVAHHAVMKGLWFFGAGAIVHATGTRTLSAMGGLARPMPATSVSLLIGALALSAVPPLCGFVSELLIMLACAREFLHGGLSALAGPVVAMAGALAVACFARLYGSVFLGAARATLAVPAHDPHAALSRPIAVLATVAVALGLAPALLGGTLDRVLAVTMPGANPALGDVVSLGAISAFTGALWVGLGGAWLVWRVLKRRRELTRAPTWDCGYHAPTARMQYGPGSLAESVRGLFQAVLRPTTRRPRLTGLYPGTQSFSVSVEDPVLDPAITGTLGGTERLLVRLRRLQHGRAQVYVLYVMLTALFLLAWQLL